MKETMIETHLAAHKKSRAQIVREKIPVVRSRLAQFVCRLYHVALVPVQEVVPASAG